MVLSSQPSSRVCQIKSLFNLLTFLSLILPILTASVFLWVNFSRSPLYYCFLFRAFFNPQRFSLSSFHLPISFAVQL